MDLDWCIRCDKRTQGGNLYCSDTCRLDDHQTTGSVGAEQNSVNGLFGPADTYLDIGNLVSPSSSPNQLGHHQPTYSLSPTHKYPSVGYSNGRLSANESVQLPTSIMMRSLPVRQRRRLASPLLLEKSIDSRPFSLTGSDVAKDSGHSYRANADE